MDNLFIEAHSSTGDGVGGVQLAFIKSLNVSTFPCGRRRSQLIRGSTENYYIPFDPEARLNTEANNRKHSSLNGFTQNYIRKWDYDSLSLVLGGYLFDIKLAGNTSIDESIDDFGNAVVGATETAQSNPMSIYANVIIEDVALYSGFTDYNTGVLRNQTNTSTAETEIDLLAKDKEDSQSADNYYFSGLSFSTSPLTEAESAPSSEVSKSSPTQKIISLRILEKVGSLWKKYQPAILPDVRHGNTEDSIEVGTLYVDKIKQGDLQVPSLTLEHIVDNGNNVYRMCFSSITD